MSDEMSAADDEVAETDLIETQNAEVEEVASSSIPEDMEGAVIEAPGKDVYPAYLAYAAAGAAASGFGYSVGSNVGDAVTNAAVDYVSSLFAVQDATGEPTDTVVSKHSSVDDLLDAHEEFDN